VNFLDLKTIVTIYIISNFVCAVMIFSLYVRNYRHFKGLGFWLADYVMQFLSLCLMALRGVAPDWFSVTVSNALAIGGFLLLYSGLEHFFDRRSPQVYNLSLLVGFVGAHTYFVIQPAPEARDILVSLTLLVVCAQSAWLMLRRVALDMRPLARSLGQLFILYCLSSAVSVAVEVAFLAESDLVRGEFYEAVLVILYQTLAVVLALSLYMLVNRRLNADLERDIQARTQAEVALKLSEEKFQKAFHASPDSVVISRISDGQMVEVNAGFCRISGYTRDEALGNSSVALALWAHPQDRATFVATLRRDGRIREAEYEFRSKTGQPVHGLLSAEIIQIGNEPHILSLIHDITERRQADAALRASDERHQAFIAQSFEAIYRTEFDQPIDISLPTETQIDLIYERAYMAECNQALADMYKLPSAAALVGTRLRDAHGGTENPVKRALLWKFIENGYKSSNDETQEFDALGNPVWFLSNTVGIVQGGQLARMWGTSINITERKQNEAVFQIRLKLFEFSSEYSLNELMQKALDEISVITRSPIGFYHFVEPDQRTLSLQAWSTRTLEEFCHADGSGLRYPIDQAGAWTECVRERRPVIRNDYPALPTTRREGLPAGHAAILRELVVPILGVGNKPTEYI
jgi:PAS domain S-box-containing protein